jgi:hypothetical protein
MPIPPETLLQRLGPAVDPFERLNTANQSLPPQKLAIGESTLLEDFLYEATDDGSPPNVVVAGEDRLLPGSCYLWVIKPDGRLFVIFEHTPVNSRRGHACHTNITGGEKALQGGEMWFLGDKRVFVNFKSGRYGRTTIDQEIAVIEYFKNAGYVVINSQ